MLQMLRCSINVVRCCEQSSLLGEVDACCHIFIFLFKYLVEWLKVYYEFKVDHSEVIDELRREKKELENLLTQQKLANVENRTREELQVCKEIFKQREALWKSYKEQIEKLCDKSHKCCKEVADSSGSAEE